MLSPFMCRVHSVPVHSAKRQIADEVGMRCRLCGNGAGWLRRMCLDCRKLWTVWLENRGAGLRGLMENLARTEVPAEKIEMFLDAELQRGEGSIRDQVAADMANQLLFALGQSPSQTSAGAKRLRDRGNWRSLDQRPEEFP